MNWHPVGQDGGLGFQLNNTSVSVNYLKRTSGLGERLIR